MLFKEEDINFERITPGEFEELCFDLLLRMGYQSLIWRQGGADQGRDIEGKFIVNNQLVGSIEEKWFFECKHYTNGVPVEQIVTKIAWADAEKPNHVVLFTTSYFSNSSRNWIEKIQKDKQYKIHVIENKLIKFLLLNSFPDLIDKYFVNKYEKLLLEGMKNWLIHDLLPNPQIISLFTKELVLERLTINEVAFLWSAGKYNLDEVNEWCLEDSNEPFSLDFLFYHLSNESNCCNEPVINLKDNIKVINCSYGMGDWDYSYGKCLRAKLLYNNTLSLYTFVRDSEGEGIEVLINANSDFTTKIRYFNNNSKTEMNNARKLLFEEIDFI